MRLRLERTWCGEVCTVGTLTVDGITECMICEDVVRGNADPATVNEWKVYGESAIPRGTYRVIVTYSQRFKRDLPLLVDVPGFQGIRIHPGNTAEDTHGCLLPGRYKTPTGVGESRKAFDALFAKIDAAIEGGQEVSIEIC